MEHDRTREVSEPSPSSGRWLWAVVMLLGCISILSLAYAVRERREAAQTAADAAGLAAENKQITATLGQTRSQVDALAAKLNALAIQLSPPPSPGLRDTEIHRPTIQRLLGPRAVHDQPWKTIQDRLAQQQKAIATTRGDLQKTRSELEDRLSSAREALNGSIARTHDELVALEKKGERNYYEFDLAKSKQFRNVGPLSLALRKTDSKRQYYDMALLVDDRQLSKKHVNLYEPMLIYPADSHEPLEIVVNKIGKDEVQGYISAPKYPEAARAALGLTAGAASAPASTGSSSTRVAGSQRPSAQP